MNVISMAEYKERKLVEKQRKILESLPGSEKLSEKQLNNLAYQMAKKEQGDKS